MNRTVAKREVSAARMGAAETFGACIMIVGALEIELPVGCRCMPQDPITAPRVWTGRIAHAHPSRRIAKLVSFADHKCLARSVRHLLNRHLTAAEEDTRVGATLRVRHPGSGRGSGTASRAIGIDIAFRSNV